MNDYQSVENGFEELSVSISELARAHESKSRAAKGMFEQILGQKQPPKEDQSIKMEIEIEKRTAERIKVEKTRLEVELRAEAEASQELLQQQFDDRMANEIR